MEVAMQIDAVENALAAVEASRALRERAMARRIAVQQRLEAAVKPLYVLRKNNQQLEFPLQ
jgi:hypothetical protein